VERLQLLGELGERRFAEAGADATGVAELTLPLHAQQ
jgi:hypothetical protein